MRLIDADALKPDVLNLNGEPIGYSTAAIDAAPTVCCEECVHAMTWVTPKGEEFPYGNCYAAVGQANGDDGDLSHNPPDFGCSYFERRTP